MRSFTSRMARMMLPLGAGLMVVVALAGGAPTSAAGVAGSTTIAVLPAGGGWAAYRFAFPGPGSRVGVTATYSPADGFTEANGVVSFDVYPPDDPHLQGKPLGSGTKAGIGQLTYQLSSPSISVRDQAKINLGEMDPPSPAGDYIVIVHNWDPKGRPLTVQLATTDLVAGTSGPALKLVSASTGAEVTPAAPEPTGTKAPGQVKPAVAAKPTSAAPSTVTTVVPAHGGWVAYSFPYWVTGKQVGVTASYSPVDGFTEVKDAIGMEAYSPLDPHMQGAPIGRGTKTGPGKLYWQLGTLRLVPPSDRKNEQTPVPENETQDPTVSPVGNYVVIIRNWDPLGRPVTITLTTTDAQLGGPGPGLTLMSSSK